MRNIASLSFEMSIQLLFFPFVSKFVFFLNCFSVCTYFANGVIGRTTQPSRSSSFFFSCPIHFLSSHWYASSSTFFSFGQFVRVPPLIILRMFPSILKGRQLFDKISTEEFGFEKLSRSSAVVFSNTHLLWF